MCIPEFSIPLRLPGNIRMNLADPPYAIAGTKGSWKLTFILPRSIGKQEKLRLQASGGRNNKVGFNSLQSDNPSEDNYISCYLQGKESTPLKLTELDLPGQKVNKGTFEIDPGDNTLEKGAVLTFVMGDRGETEKGADPGNLWRLNKFFVLYVSDDKFENDIGWEKDWGSKVAEKPLEGVYWTKANHGQILDYALIHILGGKVERLCAYSPSESIAGKPFEITVTPQDQFDNLSMSGLRNLEVWLEEHKLNAKIGNVKNTPTVKITVTLSEPGIHRIIIKDKNHNLATNTNPIRIVSEKSALVPYWGMIHGHSEISDGSCTMDHYFRQFRDVCGMDFGAPGDHDHLAETSDEFWRHTCERVRKYNSPGHFVTFLGYEFAKWRKEGEGDRNVYYLENGRPMYRSDFGHYPWPNDLFKAVANEKCIIIPHHTTCSGSFCNWLDHDPEHERLVEIFQTRGSQECPEEEGNTIPPYNPNPAGYVSEALKMGWRVGFTSGGDEHSYKVGMEKRERSAGMMCVFAKELTKKSLWEGMWNRRVVATTGPRVILDYKLNEFLMGTEINSRQFPEVSRKRRISIDYNGTSDVSKVDIIRNGESVKTFNNLEKDFSLEWTDHQELEDINLPPVKYCEKPFTFYYIRVIQKDKHIAWASPVWID